MPEAKPLPSRKELQEKYTYVPKTGLLYHNKLGRVVGTKSKFGMYFTHKKQTFRVHRVAWKMVTGKDPVETIDHINRDPLDNRWVNLREATRAQQCCNRTRASEYLKGASRNRDKWVAQIHNGGKKIHIGSFDTEMEAHLAYCYHAEQVHKEFACLD